MAEQRILDLSQKLDNELRSNIIDRYHNSEYWDNEMIKAFFQDRQVYDDEKQEVLDVIGGKI